MGNLKICVNSEDESKEAQELFFELGGKWCASGCDIKHTDEPYFYLENGLVLYGYSAETFITEKHKEITLPDLRDLVVLNRNSIDDATHEDKNDPEFKYRLIDNHWHVITEGNPVWRKDSIDLNEASLFIKPIEKTEMKAKEYLNKETYAYVKAHDLVSKDSNWIEIPEGAESFNYFGNEGNVFFLKNNSEITLYSNETEDWAWQDWGDIDFDGVVCLWKRETLNDQAASADQHTLPEELPFIDDECYTNKSDGGFRLPNDEPRVDTYKSEFGIEPPISLNDQYAEIEKVRQSHRTASETSNPTIKETLNQRQSQYGSFEDVAMITEQMVDVMRKGYYENLAYNQKMALYMICSKMARIVNGDPNHKDSWHDIAGYATLIDNELESEKDMPF